MIVAIKSYVKVKVIWVVKVITNVHAGLVVFCLSICFVFDKESVPLITVGKGLTPSQTKIRGQNPIHHKLDPQCKKRLTRTISSP
jgi:hypothetical protein